ncbi:MAG: ribosome-associated translation inhibitor RaiA [Candidatus Falkowbacteria bacterium]
MNIDIKATNLELTPALKNYIQEKMDMLDKYLGDTPLIHAHFEVELTTKHHVKGEIFRAEANLNLPHDMLRIEKTEKDMYKAIDKVKDHLKEMIVKYKEKLVDKKRQ